MTRQLHLLREFSIICKWIDTFLITVHVSDCLGYSTLLILHGQSAQKQYNRMYGRVEVPPRLGRR